MNDYRLALVPISECAQKAQDARQEGSAVVGPSQLDGLRAPTYPREAEPPGRWILPSCSCRYVASGQAIDISFPPMPIAWGLSGVSPDVRRVRDGGAVVVHVAVAGHD